MSDVKTPNPTLSESQLILPILLALAHAKAQGLDGLSTPQLREAVVRFMDQTGLTSEEDFKTTGSGEVRIERLTRNAISSHKVLEKRGLAQTVNGVTSITPEGEKQIVEFYIRMWHGDEPQEASSVKVPIVVEDAPKVSESDLVAPALIELAKAAINESGPVSTAQLISGITASMPWSPHDMSTIESGDIRAERLIRNLKSHKKLINLGYAQQEEQGLTITSAGWAHLYESFMEVSESSYDFSTPARRRPKP